MEVLTKTRKDYRKSHKKILYFNYLSLNTIFQINLKRNYSVDVRIVQSFTKSADCKTKGITLEIDFVVNSGIISVIFSPHLK